MARKAALPSDASEVADFEEALGEAKRALKRLILAKELRQLQEAIASGDEEG